MASLATANLPSSDEEDEDFVPDEVDSEEEGKNKAKKAAKKKRRMRGVTTAGAEDSDGEGDGDGAPAAPVEPEHKRLEKKAKMDDLWSKMNAGGGAAKPKAGGVNLAALCKPISAQSKKKSGDESWMRQLGLSASAKPRSAAPVDARSVAAAALASAKVAASLSTAQQHGMVTVTETRRFAGKTITMERQVDAGSKDAAKAAEAGPSDTAAAANKKSGLDAVLESLAQAKKVTVLDKTKADWQDFRKKNEEVEEELEAHKRSGATYLEKQAFLGRADVAEYERERDRRLASDVRNRGRL